MKKFYIETTCGILRFYYSANEKVHTTSLDAYELSFTRKKEALNYIKNNLQNSEYKIINIIEERTKIIRHNIWQN